MSATVGGVYPHGRAAALTPDLPRRARARMIKSAPIIISTTPTVESRPETRAYYLEHSSAFTPRSIEEEIRRAARAGFNVLMFPVYVNGFTLFPSEAVRSRGYTKINPLFRTWDPVETATRIAHEVGVHLWGFARPYNFHPRYSVAPHRLLSRFPDWRVDIHPNMRRLSLRDKEQFNACPVNPDYRRYLGDLLVELIMGYPLDGLVINFTGYPFRRGSLETGPFCYCPACRRKYGDTTGGQLVADALDPAGLDRVRDWQRLETRISTEYLRHRLMKIRRTMRLIFRARPEWRWSGEDSGSGVDPHYCVDWQELQERGTAEAMLVDHDNETAPEHFRTRLVSDLAKLHPEAFIIPSLQVHKPSDLELPIEAVRRYPVPGFLAEFTYRISDEDADLIREKYFAESAQSPDHRPLLSAAWLLRRVAGEHSDNPLIRDFMRDFLRLIEKQVRGGASFHHLELILQNLAGLQDAIRRGRLGDYHIPEQSMRHLSLARRIIRLSCLDVRT